MFYFYPFFDRRWKIRIGDDNHGSTADDRNAKDLDILASFVHPNYNGDAAYFDVAVLETEPLNFSKSIRPGFSYEQLINLQICMRLKVGQLGNALVVKEQ